ncbi:MAG: hypothetical protein QOD35_1355 [Nocardioidaceae bacterium]|jgi:hypothetical protein|nr:hypothetical protein [Nocardioidaceae bacterium]
MKLGVGVAAIVLVALGCGGGEGKPSTGDNAARAGAAGTSSCASLVGQPFDLTQVRTCTGGSGASGSGGCYPSGKRDGKYYWVSYPENNSKMLYGRPGGIWASGPNWMAMSKMAERIGC